MAEKYLTKYIIAFIAKKSKSKNKEFLLFCFFVHKIIQSEVRFMAKFFSENKEIRDEFDKLPLAVKNAIIESGVEISSVEQLRKAAQSIEDNM